MKVNELNNLFVGYNEDQDFRVLICATDIQEASDIARSYRVDTGMEGEFVISEFTDLGTYLRKIES